MLRQSLKPSSQEPERLLEAIKLLFINSPFGTRNSEEWMEGKMKMWCHKLGMYPMWAIEKAVLWDSGGSQEVTLEQFRDDVRLACGYNCLETQNMLERLLSDAGCNDEHIAKLESELA